MLNKVKRPPHNIVFWAGNTNSLRITAEVDEEDIALVKVGQTALIKANAFPDAEIEGIISDTTPQDNPIDKNCRNSPLILLADEPTGNLDTRNSVIVFDMFEILATQRKKTIITITHEPYLSKRVGYQINIVDGEAMS